MLMTAKRFEELRADPRLISCREEEQAFYDYLAYEKRCQRAKRSAETRRQKQLAKAEKV